MNRRDIIKGLGLTFGYAVAAPSVLSILESCSTKKEDLWEAVFLNGNEKHYISHLVDIILPATDTPGGLDVNLPQFIDMMSHDMLRSEEQVIFKDGSLVFAQRFKDKFNKDIGESNRDELAELFANYFDLEPDVQSKVLTRQRKELDKIELSEMDDYKMYSCLIQIRKLSLFGYFTSEKIGREVLNFDPIPGSYDPCIPVADIGNAWTI
ncbi:gluconate 2-dehydrogenase subunit 3 family protein [Lutimonas halocynthiae]|uniref:gluconate 2-dehydrogenase subunit 3 family protein n=1 Tax=Lutimonas halocynthiae TaxID=1446477 RepID=UPI0025B36FF2|nr:gluconate 2-dehydrogenase subunit 3 family protein [Lutimonas halocynthiae]MDN3643453.1 gluconate 2-dehydrogenase subunit 3 family protein [Lutimonas halocynthiae]